jgi:hypothetical protein
MRRIIVAAVLGAFALSLGGCAALSAFGNAALGTTPASISTTVTLDATKGLFAAEAAVDWATVAAGDAAARGAIKGAAAKKVLDLVDKAHGYIEAAHAGVTLGRADAIAVNAQAAINTASDAKALLPDVAVTLAASPPLQ